MGMNKLLMVLWTVALGFFIWEFVTANSLPAKYANLTPVFIRTVDVAFALITILTLIYLFRNR